MKKIFLSTVIIFIALQSFAQTQSKKDTVSEECNGCMPITTMVDFVIASEIRKREKDTKVIIVYVYPPAQQPKKKTIKNKHLKTKK